MAETTPRSKIQIIDRPLVKPGKCANCGAAAKPVVDIGLTVEWFGRFYLCTDCAVEVATAIGYVPQAELLEVQLASSQSFEEILDERNLVAIPGESIRNLVATFDDIRLSFIDGSNSVPVEESDSSGKETGTGTQGESKGNSLLDSDSSRDDNTSSSKGSVGVPSITGLELD